MTSKINDLFSFLCMFVGLLIILNSISISAFADVKETSLSWNNVQQLKSGSIVHVELKDRYLKGELANANGETISLIVTYLRERRLVEVKRNDVIRVFLRKEPEIQNSIKYIGAIPLKIVATPVGFAAESGSAFWYGDGRYNLFELLKFGTCGATHGLDLFPKKVQELADIENWALIYSAQR